MTDIVPVPNWGGVRQLETNEYATGGLNGNMNEQAKSLAGQNMYSRLYAGLPFDPVFTTQVGGFPVGGKAALENGDIVRSTVANNTANPNVDMTGWENSKAIQQVINEKFNELRVISFESLGGVGDGDYLTGTGTDNAAAFALAQIFGENGYTIKFKSNAQYKTTSEIVVHNMNWIGDKNSTPIIFGWFSTTGKRIIRKNASADKKTASIDGLTLWRCGPNPEHGINIDNMSGFYLRGKVLGVPFCNGGAIGVSAFYTENRPSQNVHIDAYLEKTGDYGVEFGDVQHGSLRVNGQNVWREIIGFEPIMRDVFEITSGMFADSTFTVANHGMSTGDPVIYYANTNTALFENSRHYFAIIIDANNFKIADTRKMAYSNLSMTSAVAVAGTHLIARCGIVEDIDVLSCILNDVDSVKPPLFGNSQGYVVLTATSGGWTGNINFNPLQITSNRRTADGLTTIGIRADGCSDMTIKNPTVNGCDTSLRFLRGDVGNWKRKNGTKITPLGTCTISPRRNVVINPVLKDFKVQGIYAQHDNNQFIGGSIQSNFVGAVGINDTTNLAGTTYVGGMVVDCPNGTDLVSLTGVLAQDLRLISNGKLLNTVDLFNASIITTKPKVKKSGEAIIALKSTNQQSSSTYIGAIDVLVSSEETNVSANKALYKLQVTKAFSGATPTIALLSSYGLTTGGASNHPSFTFTIVGDNLIATAVGSTSTSGNFYFSIKATGFINFS